MFNAEDFKSFLDAYKELKKINPKQAVAFGKYALPSILKTGVQETAGIAVILALSHLNVNKNISDLSNNLLFRLQAFEDSHNVDGLLQKKIKSIGEAFNFSPQSIKKFQIRMSDLTKPENYITNRIDIEIFEVALLQAGIVQSKTNIPIATVSAFVYNWYVLDARKDRLIREGKETKLSDVITALPFGVGYGLKPIIKIFEPVDLDNANHFDFTDDPETKEEFTNGYDTDSTTADSTDEDYNELLKDAVDNNEPTPTPKVESILYDPETKDFLNQPINNKFDNESIVYQKQADKLKADIYDTNEFVIKEDTTPIMDTSKDGFKPFFDNSPLNPVFTPFNNLPNPIEAGEQIWKNIFG